MTTNDPTNALQSRLERGREFIRGGQVLQAELLYLGILKDRPGQVDATLRLAELAMRRGDGARAVDFLQALSARDPGDAAIAVDLALAHLISEQPENAIAALESALQHSPEACLAWLLLGQVRESVGDAKNALKAQFQAVTRAQRAGLWISQATTPPQLLAPVVHAIERVRLGRRELFFGSFDDLLQQFGPRALARVERALSGYLREWDSTPSDPRQRPKFFYFPDLPNTPYHDPYLQPWAQALQAAFPQIRADALRIVEEERRLPNFVREGERVENFVSGSGPMPSWEAFFFYRRGERFDANHARCPDTSALLESIELCRIADQAPEILFSVLKPGSHINAHHGVSNVRLVMHLPLLVPPDCALNLIEHGEHHWVEGRLVMFDDTYLHEAWNRSNSTRVVLLMDCWNPHLTDVERRAVKQLIETVTSLKAADRASHSVQSA